MPADKPTTSALAEDVYRICGTNNPLTPLGIARSFKVDPSVAMAALESLTVQGKAQHVGGERYQLIKPWAPARPKRGSDV